MNLRQSLLRLAHERPEFRRHLLPLLRFAGTGWYGTDWRVESQTRGIPTYRRWSSFYPLGKDDKFLGAHPGSLFGAVSIDCNIGKQTQKEGGRWVWRARLVLKKEWPKEESIVKKGISPMAEGAKAACDEALGQLKADPKIRAHWRDLEEDHYKDTEKTLVRIEDHLAKGTLRGIDDLFAVAAEMIKTLEKALYVNGSKLAARLKDLEAVPRKQNELNELLRDTEKAFGWALGGKDWREHMEFVQSFHSKLEDLRKAWPEKAQELELRFKKERPSQLEF